MTVKRPEYLNRPSHEHPIFHGGWQEVHKVANELWKYVITLEARVAEFDMLSKYAVRRDIYEAAVARSARLEAELSDAAHALVEDDSARLNAILRARYRKES
jgi:hypothetical protein